MTMAAPVTPVVAAWRVRKGGVIYVYPSNAVKPIRPYPAHNDIVKDAPMLWSCRSMNSHSISPGTHESDSRTKSPTAACIVHKHDQSCQEPDCMRARHCSISHSSNVLLGGIETGKLWKGHRNLKLVNGCDVWTLPRWH